MIAHFFDIETILKSDSKVWVIDKNKPNNPIIKIDRSDFNLIKRGIYKSQSNRIDFAGDIYWLPNELFDTLKVRCKVRRCDLGNLAFSMQEFMNKDVIETIDYELKLENILHIKNTNDDIYFICSENNKSNYEKIIKKIENKLEDNGLFIKKYYFISDSFFERDYDEISYKKVRLLVQHLLGFKTDGDKFIDEPVTKYDDIYFYDDDLNTIKLATDCNDLLHIMLGNTDNNTVKLQIKELLKYSHNILYVNQVTTNKLRRFISTKVKLEYNNLIKAFERFNWKK
jgi:hypothetical protein